MACFGAAGAASYWRVSPLSSNFAPGCSQWLPVACGMWHMYPDSQLSLSQWLPFALAGAGAAAAPGAPCGANGRGDARQIPAWAAAVRGWVLDSWAYLVGFGFGFGGGIC
jgi:hypothetical protein